MNGANNSLSLQLEILNIYHENYVKLANAYYDALTSSKSTIPVNLTNRDGSTTTIVIPSTIHLQNELTKLSSSFKNLIGLSEDGKSRLVSSNESTFREIFVQDFLNSKEKVFAEEVKSNEFINVSNNPIVESLLSPLTTLELQLPSEKYNTVKNVIVERYNILSGDFSEFTEGMSYADVRRLLNTERFEFSKVETSVPVDFKKTRYHGDFSVESVKVESSNLDERFSQIVVAKLNTLRYNDEASLVDNSVELNIGDFLVKSDGSVKYEIITIDRNSRIVKLGIVSGLGAINQNSKLVFLEQFANTISIQIPVRLNEKSVIFLSPVERSTSISSPRSTAKLFDSSNYQVRIGNTTHNFNQYFSEKVSDIGRYFDSLIIERSIGLTEGVKPATPILEDSNFKIVQINKHLFESSSSTKLQNLNKQKAIVKNQLDVTNNSINTINSRISTGNYSSPTKKIADQTELQKLSQQKIENVQLLATIVDEIKNTNVLPESVKPKYRVRGFWDVQDDLVDQYGNPQKIVQYQVRYRYLSPSTNVGNVEQFVYTKNDGNKVNAVFSGWNYVKTEPLQKEITADKAVSWQINQPADVNSVSINQLDIPIIFGETVEIQVRAITEAGYPANPLMSEWSNIISKQLTEEYLQLTDVESIMKQNSLDSKNVEIEKAFQNQGITKHVASSYEEQERYFAHKLSQIASNKVSEDSQKTISAEELISSLEMKIQALDEIVNRRYSSLTIQLVDEDSRTYDVNNFSTIKLFAGNYDEEVDLSVAENYGTIVTKTFYLKLANLNAQTMEILSIDPGSLINVTSVPKYSNVPVLYDAEFQQQRKAQIFYNRDKNLNENLNLYMDAENSLTSIPASDIENTVSEAEKNIVYKNLANSFEIVKLKSSASLQSYVACTTSHPAYRNFLQTGSTTGLQQVFDRIQYFNELFRTSNVQQILDANKIYNFEDEDKFLIGQNSVGAALYCSLNSIASYQVQGIDTASSKEIYPGLNDSIMIPIVFQYRMTDALGNANGENTLASNANFEYSKILGFDLFLAGKTFSFDVQITSKFRATATSNTKVGIVTSTNNLRTKIS